MVNFVPIPKFVPTDVRGLTPSGGHPFFWTKDGKTTPDFLRWSWHPVTGDLLIGTAPLVLHHNYQIPRNYPWSFASWLRAFYFTKERLFAFRPYFWTQDPYERYSDVQHDCVLSFVIPELKKVSSMVNFERKVDNDWLMARFSKYSTDW